MNKEKILKVVLVTLVFFGIFLLPELFQDRARRVVQVVVFILLIVLGILLIKIRRSRNKS